jgi:hypothetical protein
MPGTAGGPASARRVRSGPAAPASPWRLRLLVLIAVIGALASLVADWPGHFSVDSVNQMSQARLGRYNDWHPPIMAWLLRWADRLTPGAVSFIVADTCLFFASLLVFATSERRPRWIGVLAMALMAATPQALIFQGVVWKDILFADTTVGAFAALALAGRHWGCPAARAACLAVAFALFLIAALSRQTGIVIAAVGAASFVAIAWAARPAPRRLGLAAPLSGLFALCALAGLVAAISFAFALDSDGQPGRPAQVALLQTYDLAGVDHFDPRLAMPALHRHAPALEWFMRAEAGPRFRPGSIDYLDALPAAEAVLPPPGKFVAPDWKQMILQHPLLYLKVRAWVFWVTLARPESQQCPLVSVGIQTDADDDLAHAGLENRIDAKDKWDDAYVEAFDGGPVLSHLVWGALAVCLLGLGVVDVVRRGDRRPATLAAIGLLIAALAFVASFLPVALACDYRYFYLLDLAAMTALVHRACARRVEGKSTAKTRRRKDFRAEGASRPVRSPGSRD